MYGNYEYGTVAYGDVIGVTTVVVIIDKDEVEVLFIAKARPEIFISLNKKNLFVAEEKFYRRLLNNATNI